MTDLSDSPTQNLLRIALAAGGTGGHIMPTLALAEALREARPNIELLFFSGQKEQEIRWYGQAGITPVQLPAAPLAAGLAGKWRAASGTLKAFVLARKTLQQFRPQCLVGLGSYVAGSSILAAMSLGIPFVIHEQNSVAGKANRWLAGRAAVVASTYPRAFAGRKLKRLELTGNPLRKRLLEPVAPEAAKRHFQLDEKRPVLLVSGASQGARGLNQALLDLLRPYTNPNDLNWQILWITGARNFEAVSGELAPLACSAAARLFPFIEEMGMAYAAADVVVCRASSSTLAEVAAWGKPMVAVPYPYAAEDHQRHNAEDFSAAGACVVVDERELSAERLQAEVQQIFGNPEVYQRMARAATALARPHAAADLAQVVLEVAQSKCKQINRS